MRSTDYCNKCGKKLAWDEVGYCGQCATAALFAKLKVNCPGCGAECPPWAAECLECGAVWV